MILEFRLEEGDPHFKGVEADEVVSGKLINLSSEDAHFAGIEGDVIECARAWRWNGSGKLKMNIYEAKKSDHILTFVFKSRYGLSLYTYEGELLFKWERTEKREWIRKTCKIPKNASNVYFSAGKRQSIIKQLFVAPVSTQSSGLIECRDYWLYDSLFARRPGKIYFRIDEWLDSYRCIRFEGLSDRWLYPCGSATLYAVRGDKTFEIGVIEIPSGLRIPPRYSEFYIVPRGIISKKVTVSCTQ